MTLKRDKSAHPLVSYYPIDFSEQQLDKKQRNEEDRLHRKVSAV
jgi:hypothetical protein